MALVLFLTHLAGAEWKSCPLGNSGLLVSSPFPLKILRQLGTEGTYGHLQVFQGRSSELKIEVTSELVENETPPDLYVRQLSQKFQETHPGIKLKVRLTGVPGDARVLDAYKASYLQKGTLHTIMYVTEGENRGWLFELEEKGARGEATRRFLDSLRYDPVEAAALSQPGPPPTREFALGQDRIYLGLHLPTPPVPIQGGWVSTTPWLSLKMLRDHHWQDEPSYQAIERQLQGAGYKLGRTYQPDFRPREGVGAVASVWEGEKGGRSGLIWTAVVTHRPHRWTITWETPAGKPWQEWSEKLLNTVVVHSNI
ncbi:hypothetical protein IV102_03025 [bacterium]|nr:hypothetical protein [bacterium]